MGPEQNIRESSSLYVSYRDEKFDQKRNPFPITYAHAYEGNQELQ